MKHLILLLGPLLLLGPSMAAGDDYVSGAERGYTAEEAAGRLAPFFEGVDAACWVVDVTGSMADDLCGVMEEFKTLEGLVDDKDKLPVPMSIITFADDPKLRLRPTRSLDVVAKKLAAIKPKPQGAEFVFKAIDRALEECAKPNATLLVIVVTDEAGDDPRRLEPCLQRCHDAGARVVHLGRHAAFGRSTWRWNEATSRGKEVVRADLGCETPRGNLIWDDFLIQKVLDPTGRGLEWAASSGFGFWHLSRLARETGGAFIPLASRPKRLPLVSAYPRPLKGDYRPDLASPDELAKNAAKNPLRHALRDALEAYEALPPLPRILKVTDVPGAQALMREDLRLINTRLEGVETILAKLIKVKAHYFESSLRWRADWELAAASLAVASLHMAELRALYSQALKDPGTIGLTGTFGELLVLPRRFPRDSSRMGSDQREAALEVSLDAFEENKASGNREIVTEQIQTLCVPVAIDDGPGLLKRARGSCEVVVHNHPGTPWAVMAAQLHRYLGGGYFFAKMGARQEVKEGTGALGEGHR